MIVDTSQGFTYDDVILVPQYSEIASRSNISTKTVIGNSANAVELDIPIISANMDTVTGISMYSAMRKVGAYGFLHRFASDEQRLMWARTGFPVTVGVGNLEKELAKSAVVLGAKHFLIDIAHGNSKHVVDMLRYIRELCPTALIVAGNIATADAALLLADEGADVVKIGVGPGSVCTTRTVTGHGFPQLSAIDEIAEAFDLDGYDVSIIADGGIKSSGDIVKALAAGADAVMIGGLFAGS